MHPNIDVPLEDGELLLELRLWPRSWSPPTSAAIPLTQQEIDLVLGVE